NTAGFGAAKMVSRAKAEGVNGLAMAQIVRADVTRLPAFVGVEIPGMGYGVYRIGKVQQPAEVDVARRKSEEEQIGNLVAQQDLMNYVEVLKQKAKVKVLKPISKVAAATEQ
ncbi:MAG: peptidylprolyl isomerase, partial [Paucibacter sp.]|nr:peptidylprolyl isomerase [Roseateles sp.]